LDVSCQDTYIFSDQPFGTDRVFCIVPLPSSNNIYRILPSGFIAEAAEAAAEASEVACARPDI
jgi:hypothetical protein